VVLGLSKKAAAQMTIPLEPVVCGPYGGPIFCHYWDDHPQKSNKIFTWEETEAG